MAALAEAPDLEKKLKSAQIRASVYERLTQSGEKDRLKDILRERLINCGWRDKLKEHCKEIIKTKGLERITVEELMAEVVPRGRATVPECVKAEMLQMIKTYLANNTQAPPTATPK